MAPSAKQFSLFFILALLSSHHTHARDSQFFNKIPSTTTATATTTTTTTAALPTTEQQLPSNQQLQQEQEPDFVPENENSYGLYSHESGQLPPSATAAATTTTSATPAAAQPLNKHLPKNYNPVAYVTEPDDVNDSSTFTGDRSFSTNPTNYNYNAAANQNYYKSQQEQELEQVEEPEFRNYPSTTTPNNNNEKFYYMGGSSFNSQPQGMSDARLRGGAATFNNGFRPQGMSDTRFLENGKYFYDVNSEKYSTNHPYESLKGVQSTNQYSNNRNFYGNRGNGYEFNNENYNVGGYNQNQEEFQNEENFNMP